MREKMVRTFLEVAYEALPSILHLERLDPYPGTLLKLNADQPATAVPVAAPDRNRLFRRDTSIRDQHIVAVRVQKVRQRQGLPAERRARFVNL